MKSILIIKQSIAILIAIIFLSSCASTEFAKRKYMPGYYYANSHSEKGMENQTATKSITEIISIPSSDNEINIPINVIVKTKNIEKQENNEYASLKHEPKIFLYKEIRYSHLKGKIQTFVQKEYKNKVHSPKKNKTTTRSGNAKNILLVVGGIIEVIGILIALSAFGVTGAGGTYTVGITLMAIGGLLGLIGYLMKSD